MTTTLQPRPHQPQKKLPMLEPVTGHRVPFASMAYGAIVSLGVTAVGILANADFDVESLFTTSLS